jgi:hypothetical protein
MVWAAVIVRSLMDCSLKKMGTGWCLRGNTAAARVQKYDCATAALQWLQCKVRATGWQRRVAKRRWCAGGGDVDLWCHASVQTTGLTACSFRMSQSIVGDDSIHVAHSQLIHTGCFRNRLAHPRSGGRWTPRPSAARPARPIRGPESWLQPRDHPFCKILSCTGTF